MRNVLFFLIFIFVFAVVVLPREVGSTVRTVGDCMICRTDQMIMAERENVPF